jgi:hypothetical protein
VHGKVIEGSKYVEKFEYSDEDMWSTHAGRIDRTWLMMHEI